MPDFSKHRGTLKSKQQRLDPNGEVHKFVGNKGTFYYDILVFETDGAKIVTGEYQTNLSTGTKFTTGKVYDFEFYPSSNAKFNGTIKNVVDPFKESKSTESSEGNNTNGSYGGGRDFETAAERYLRQRFIIAENALSNAVAILGPNHPLEEYFPIQDAIAEHTLSWGGTIEQAMEWTNRLKGNVKPLTEQPLPSAQPSLTPISDQALNGMCNHIQDGFFKDDENIAIKHIMEVLMGLSRYSYSNVQAKKIASVIYEATLPPAVNDLNIPPANESTGGNSDLPF